MKSEHLHFYDQKKEELAHYSKATTDIEYLYPFGFDELWPRMFSVHRQS